MKPPSRTVSIAALWAWLPAFRAVAETEHLPSAAQGLGVTPSTLSRAIAALERRLGKPLFTRSGRNLRLNGDGAALLATVREAMHRVEDGVDEVVASSRRGPLLVASSGAGTTAIVAPALIELRRRYPELLPQVVTRSMGDTGADLLRGRLDIAFQEQALARPGLTVTRVGTVVRGVYCGRRHPLFAARKVAVGDLVAHEFVAPPPDESGRPLDGWPDEIPRRVGLVVDQLRIGLELCCAEPLLAVLPEALADERGDALRRLPLELIPATPLFAMHRQVLRNRPSLAAEFVQLVRERGDPAR
ncbi:MAG: LysR family transcriptional regulator [Planctomycetes bacterium]|nr:LysR family transcriptional regulator [Planctomycetota bacterium]MCB9887332.1 LysR family transcriptional regulator [Planctomycetota bacterium]